MTYRGIDRNRFTYLLSLGADENELRKFFTDSRIQLIQNGGKVQNLPQGLKARIRTLAAELPSSTDEVVQAWFAKNLTMVDSEQAEVVVDVFKTYEEHGEVLPEDSVRRYARSCLVHLFSKAPIPLLLDFLKTPIGGAKGQEKRIEFLDKPKDASQVAPYPENLPQVLIDLIEGKDPDEHLEGLPPALATFISGLQAGTQGQIKKAMDAVDALSVDHLLHNRLKEFLKQETSKAASKDSFPIGLRIPDLETFEGSFDFERDELLAYCTKADSPNAIFVHPLAVVRSTQIQLLTDEKRHSVFPKTGDVMAFAGAAHPRQPSRGEIGVWRIAEHDTEKATRFHIASEKRPVYEIRHVPFPSTDYDSVREFIREYGERTGGNSLQPLLYLLDDGLIVGSRGERLDFTKDETFESGLPAWKSLSALRFEGRLLVLGPLPKEQSVYDCASLASAVRKLFRSHIGTGKTAGGLTKAQLRELVQHFSSDQAGLDALRIQRIKAELERFGEQQEALDALVIELLNSPNVKQRIDQVVEQEAAKQLAQKNSLQSDIARLLKERGEWEDRINTQQVEHRKLRDETSKVVKGAFEKARAEGVSTLAELAIFQALSAPANVPVDAGQRSANRTELIAQPIVQELVPTGRDVISILKSIGVPSQRATAFGALGEAVMKAGLIVCVRGVAARLAVDGWARAIGHAPILFDSTIGLIDVSAIKNILTRIPPHDVLALLDANLSALDLYAKPISDLVFSQLVDHDKKPQLSILFSLADGVGSLPLPRIFDSISISLDLEKRYTFRSVSDLDELNSMVTNPEEGILYERLWRPAADRLCIHIEELEQETRALVLSVLVSQ